ncbi:MAG TPA: acetyl-coenzyme A synthetase N-terminal domain-containing protein, partial [bacterium]|nr:acetyl-coenzyme A synthetase N-terminal domain-containing protein [bacterium]
MSEEKKGITSMSLENRVFEVPESFRKKAWIKSIDEYRAMWQQSVDDPDTFWGKIASEFTWEKKWDKVYASDFANANIKWFVGGKTNITLNALDRHLATRGNQPALMWEGNDPSEDRILTYKDLHAEVCKAANVLK